MPWLPTPLYNILPYGYVTVGLITTFNIDNALGILAGILLVSAGAVVIQMRRS